MRVLLIEQIAKTAYKYTFSLANALKNNGAIVTIAIDQKKEKENCKCEMINLFNTDEKNVSKFLKLLNYISSYKKIEKLIIEKKIDILHSQWYCFSPVDYWFIRRIKKKCKVKYVSTVHDILPFNQKFYDVFFHKKLYELADSIILQSSSNIHRFADLFPESSNKTVMIPHGHFLDYAEIIQKDQARSYLNLPQEKKVILFFGQIKKVKGVDVLLQSIALLKDVAKDFLVVIAGSVQHLDFGSYQRIIDDNKINHLVRTDIKFIPDDEVKFYFSACDICVLPYTDVYQSGVVQLAYGYKKTVIASDLPAFKEFVIDGTTGYLAAAGDPEDLSKVIKKAMQNSDCWDAMGNEGANLVRKKLDWNKIAESIIKECY